jgi:hypothetical protein
MHHFIDSHRLHRGYEQEVLRQAINHVQDLYADDIAIRVLAYDDTRLQQLGDFFLGWIKERSATSGMSRKDQWINASILLNNSFAISNMERHKAAGEQIEKARLSNVRFLNRIRPTAAIRFDYFNRFMVSLKEDVSEAGFREQMEEYLRNILSLVDII